MKDMIKKCEKLPVGAIATAVGFATLSNVYAANGFPGVRHVTMLGVMFVWAAALIKITVHRKAFLKDYSNVVLASLYGTFTILTMILGSYIFGFQKGIGRVIWLVGVTLHVIHILIFTFKNVLKGIKRDTFIPSWFVTYVAFLVSVVVGADKGMPKLLTAFIYYGFAIYLVVFPSMVYRVIKYPIPEEFGMTKAIFLAPSSLLFVGYLNVVENPVHAIVFTIYGILCVTIIYIAYKLPSFLEKPFSPGHAALTFPSAIALVATFRMSGFLMTNGWQTLGRLLRQFFGIQLWVTTAVIAYVGYNFLKMFIQSLKNET